jgi:hypothetical protein
MLSFSPGVNTSNPTVLAAMSKDAGTNLDLDSPLDMIDKNLHALRMKQSKQPVEVYLNDEL